jgi:hypothetical protein
MARLDGRLVDFRAVLVPDQDIIAALSESRLLGANPVGDELGVILCFLPGTALMSPDVMRRKFPGQIEEKPLHAKRNADADPLFLTHC